MDNRGEREVVHYSTECNPLHHSTEYLFIYPPDAILVCRIPGEEKCIKPLTVFTCVGLMLMCEGRPEDGGWEIDHRLMSVEGIWTSTNGFSRFDLGNPSSRNLVPSENTTPYLVDWDVSACWGVRSGLQRCVLCWLSLVIDSLSLFVHCRLRWVAVHVNRTANETTHEAQRNWIWKPTYEKVRGTRL